MVAYEGEIKKRMQQRVSPEKEDQTAPPLPNPERMKALQRRHPLEKRQDLYRMAGVDLTAIDGVGVETGEVVMSEYGIDLHQFKREKQFVAHLQLAPRQAISGGRPLKKRRGKTTGTRAGRALRIAATALRDSRTALGAYYRRISRSKGASVAVFATARKLATLIYRLLRWGQSYIDEGQQAYEERYQALRLRSVTNTAHQLGYDLTPKTKAVTA